MPVYVLLRPCNGHYVLYKWALEHIAMPARSLPVVVAVVAHCYLSAYDWLDCYALNY